MILEDGRREHTFRQSTLETLTLCPEQARLTIYEKTVPRVETDATAAGTAMHAGIEHVLREIVTNGVRPSVSEAEEVAQLNWTNLLADPTFQWKKYANARTGDGAQRAFISSAVVAWYTRVLPLLSPVAVEAPFNFVVWEDNDYVVRWSGTMDYVDANYGVMDWKTGSREYEQWEKQRWAVQPTVYTRAAVELGLIPRTDSVPFTFVIMLRGGVTRIQHVPVTRHQGDWDWMVERCLSYVDLLGADLRTWPKTDDHALCQPKWCEAFTICKGKHYADGWPKPSDPRTVAVDIPSTACIPVGASVSSAPDIDTLFERVNGR